MQYKQDEIEYIINNGVVIEWSGDAPFKKPTWDGEKIIEGWNEQDDQTAAANDIELMPTLSAQICDELGVEYGRDIDIQIDQIEAFKPTEKQYNLLGQSTSKEYYYQDKCVCRIEYERVFEDLEHEGFTSNEFVGIKRRLIFYKDENREYFKVKEQITKRFNLVPTLVKENILVTNVVWSSADRESLLRTERYKSEQVLKSFNPILYKVFIEIFGDLYMNYKETGDNTAIVSAIQSSLLVLLDSEVKDDDKEVIFGEMETYPELTIRELIIMALP